MTEEKESSGTEKVLEPTKTSLVDGQPDKANSIVNQASEMPNDKLALIELKESIIMLLENHLSEKFEKIDEIVNKLEDATSAIREVQDETSNIKEMIGITAKQRNRWYNTAIDLIKMEKVISFVELKAEFASLGNGDIMKRFIAIAENDDIFAVTFPKAGKPRFFIFCQKDSIGLRKLIQSWHLFFDSKHGFMWSENGFDEYEKHEAMDFLDKHFKNKFYLTAEVCRMI